jgi:hypothetical protein
VGQLNHTLRVAVNIADHMFELEWIWGYLLPRITC